MGGAPHTQQVLASCSPGGPGAPGRAATASHASYWVRQGIDRELRRAQLGCLPQQTGGDTPLALVHSQLALRQMDCCTCQQAPQIACRGRGTFISWHRCRRRPLPLRPSSLPFHQQAASTFFLFEMHDWESVAACESTDRQDINHVAASHRLSTAAGEPRRANCSARSLAPAPVSAQAPCRRVASWPLVTSCSSSSAPPMNSPRTNTWHGHEGGRASRGAFAVGPQHV